MSKGRGSKGTAEDFSKKKLTCHHGKLGNFPVGGASALTAGGGVRTGTPVEGAGASEKKLSSYARAWCNHKPIKGPKQKGGSKGGLSSGEEIDVGARLDGQSLQGPRGGVEDHLL